MHKPAGLSLLLRDSRSSASFQSHGSRLRSSQSSTLQTQLSVFQSLLLQFSKTHAKDIRSHPEFRTEFARMCQALGVDPLASTGSKKGSSLWAEMLGEEVGGWYFGVAVRVVEVCRATRGENGGLISVAEVTARLNSAKGQGEMVTEDDVLRAVGSLKPLGEGFRTLELGRLMMIRSVPKELGGDQRVVMEAIQVLGFVTHSMLLDNLRWDEARVKTVIDDLLSDSLVWVDEQAQETEYWTPAFISKT
ncbi:EAP30/Vps36 family-domain-containing protein [Pyronema domesticum]|uniref:Vacuolar-sorting protein SNF8 n=1 Tax=Pyronema omphalodes (strain CBS 100304) TaxID=1076935 RepID=U4L0U3_PYROM|nr:EAP30/Vps36 family-domain-containing protein [Pyronema domesticum]CCX09237.1 Similar to Vacuolar-sorting protein SNF8; acc. no. Q5RJU0 [Pyronema omphalodes CBS 100304]